MHAWQDRLIEIDNFKMRSVNPTVFEAWSRWNEHMALYAHWFVALYQVTERSKTANLDPVRALVGGVVVEAIQEPFRELRSFMRDARDYWPAMYSCQAEFSVLEPQLVPLQRVSRHEASTLLQARMCGRDVCAFVQTSLSDEDAGVGTVCYRVPDMLPSHLRATLDHLGFAAEDIASVITAPYFVSETHTYDLFVRLNVRHDCAWQIASICHLPRVARCVFQRLTCTPRDCIEQRPTVLRTLQRSVLRLVSPSAAADAVDPAADITYSNIASASCIWLQIPEGCVRRCICRRGPGVLLPSRVVGRRDRRCSCAAPDANWFHRCRHAAQRQDVVS